MIQYLYLTKTIDIRHASYLERKIKEIVIKIILIGGGEGGGGAQWSILFKNAQNQLVQVKY